MMNIAKDLLERLGIKSDHQDYCRLLLKDLYVTSKSWDSYKERDEKLKYCTGAFDLQRTPRTSSF